MAPRKSTYAPRGGGGRIAGDSGLACPLDRRARVATGLVGWLLGGLLVFAGCAATAGRAGESAAPRGAPADQWVVAQTDRFTLRSDPRVALHHFLLAWAAAEAETWPGYAPPVREREGWRDSLSAADARTWAAAVEAYAAARDRSLLFDDGMLALRDWAVGAADRAAIPAADRAMADALETALPVYRRHWWSRHDDWNRRWIAAVEPVLDEVEESVVLRLEAAYGGKWPTGLIPTDVMVHANPVGAYSVGGRVAISSGNRQIVMPQAVDLLFHEASHIGGLERPLRDGIDAAFRAVGSEAPDRLWHDFIFFTTGEILRDVMEAAGRPGFRPYGEAAGVYDRGERWAVELPALRRGWLPFVRSGSATPAARRAALEDVARALTAGDAR